MTRTRYVNINESYSTNLLPKLTTPHSQTPTLKVELQQSLFGYGSFFDSVQMTPRNPRGSWESVNPILVISFIESVLGYQMIPGMSGNGHWQFKRETSLP